MTLAETFESFTTTAFRLETLPVYDAPEEGSELAAFSAGRPLRERSVRTSPWLARIAATTAAGREWRRLRLISPTPTRYEAWEIGRYIESQACGEQVRLLNRDDHADLVGRDFWLFDAGLPSAAVYLMRYDDTGGFHGADQAGAAQVANLERIAASAWEQGEPLNSYLATFDHHAHLPDDAEVVQLRADAGPWVAPERRAQ